jgi:hypothetical protein
MSINEFSMPMLAEAEIDRRRNRLSRVCRTIYAGSAVASFGLLQWVALHCGDGKFLENVAGGLLLGAFGSILAWVVIVHAIEDSRLDPDQYEWLPAYECDSFAEFCEEHPGVQAYRDSVRAAARRFTKGEYWAMRGFVTMQREAEYEAERTAKERAGCQRLYGIAGEA